MEEASPARQGEWLGRPKAQTTFIKSPGKKIYAVFKKKKSIVPYVQSTHPTIFGSETLLAFIQL